MESWGTPDGTEDKKD
ncbi:unnamed protein product, partial [Didymodactylos carnosus]